MTVAEGGNTWSSGIIDGRDGTRSPCASLPGWPASPATLRLARPGGRAGGPDRPRIRQPQGEPPRLRGGRRGRPGWRAAAVDLRGHGETGGALDGGVLDDVAACLDVLAAAGHAPLGIRGSSMGAMLALHAAARDPRVRAVVAICPARPERLADRIGADWPRALPLAPAVARDDGVARGYWHATGDEAVPWGATFALAGITPAADAPADRARRRPQHPAARPGGDRRDRRVPRARTSARRERARRPRPPRSPAAAPAPAWWRGARRWPA